MLVRVIECCSGEMEPMSEFSRRCHFIFLKVLSDHPSEARKGHSVQELIGDWA